MFKRNCLLVILILRLLLLVTVLFVSLGRYKIVMGFWTKHERYNPDTEKFEAVEKEPLFRKKEPSEVKELTREEQVEPKRLQPWQTPRGKRFIAGTKKVGKRLDQAGVNYNRRSNPVGRGRSYSTNRNANPFGSWFDMGQSSMRRSKPQKPKTKYVIVGGKAYPKAGTGKRKKKKSSGKRRSNDPFSFDIGFGKGW